MCYRADNYKNVVRQIRNAGRQSLAPDSKPFTITLEYHETRRYISALSYSLRLVPSVSLTISPRLWKLIQEVLCLILHFAKTRSNDKAKRWLNLKNGVNELLFWKTSTDKNQRC